MDVLGHSVRNCYQLTEISH